MNNQLKFYIRRVVLLYFNFRYSAKYPVVMPIIVTSVGVLILLLIILPQLNNLFSVQKEVDLTKNRIKTMTENSMLLGNLNKSGVDNDFEVTIDALPSEKDFLGIIKAINAAAIVSNVSLDDYQFTLGTVMKSKKIKSNESNSQPIQFTLKIDGSIQSINNFMSEIERKLPISEIKTINFTNNSGEVTLAFYAKPLPDLDITYTEPIQLLTQNERGILQTLYQWSNQ